MGLFDFFKKNPSEAPKGASGGGYSPSVAKWADKATDKRAQGYERSEALLALAKITGAEPDGKRAEGDKKNVRSTTEVEEAVEVLLRRFSFSVDPSITDQEEKDGAYEAILAAKDLAIQPVRKFAEKAESLSWPIRILKELLAEDEMVDTLLGWLEKWDTEYAKFIDPKLQVLAALEEYKGAKIGQGVVRFLEDVNETARFSAAGAILNQADPQYLEALLKTLQEEESMRVKNRILGGLVSWGARIPEPLFPLLGNLPYGYELVDGKIIKR